MNALRSEFAHHASVAEVQQMCGGNLANGVGDQLDEPLVFCDARDIGLWID